MVEKLERDGKVYYICELCNVAYDEERWAKKYAEWCSEHPGTCSIEVVRHAVELEDTPSPPSE